MKLTPWLLGVAVVAFALGSASGASDTATVYAGKYRVVKDGTYVVYTQTTNSRIPERVVLRGQHANTSSPMFVIQGNDLVRTGATSLIGMLALDPSVGSLARR